MLQVGTRIRVIDDSDFKGWTGTITTIDDKATEGDCYGVQFAVTGSGTTIFFREGEIQTIEKLIKRIEQQS